MSRWEALKEDTRSKASRSSNKHEGNGPRRNHDTNNNKRSYQPYRNSSRNNHHRPANDDLFKSLNVADCFHCHNGPLMRVVKFSNNGLDESFSDLGRALITNNPNDEGKFKVPSLRNLEFSAPYMHDGRFNSLDEVIDFYSEGVNPNSPNISPLMEHKDKGGALLTVQEKADLKAFLLTLSDYEFINNPNHQAP